MDLRDTVHGGGSHDGLIGSHDLGSRGTEGTNGGGDVKTELVLAGNLDDVLRTVDVDLESLGHENSASEAYELRVLLTNGGEKGSKVDDPGDAVVNDNLLLREWDEETGEEYKTLHVADIEVLIGSLSLVLGGGDLDIGADDAVLTVLVTED